RLGGFAAAVGPGYSEFMTYQNILYERQDRVVRLTLNRPDSLNPLSWDTIKELGTAFAEINTDPEVVIVVVTGAGKAFSAGGDLKGYLGLYKQPAEFRRYLSDFFDLCAQLERSDKIVVAAVNGACVAGGLELLLCCDLAVAADEARIGDGHLNFGQLPGAGGSQRLPRAIGAFRAKELMFSGRLLSGPEAAAIGLVNRSVPRVRLMAEVETMIEEYLTKSPAGLAGTKHLVNEGLRGSLEAGLQLEMSFVYNWATASHDATEGLIAFDEKRTPDFKGC
ncbi:MAG: enoyl-CoA hydratase/isomerase family protein, partial [Alphaproteobacteria bacterium]|nr:enoyl-CoA hydratase/isomerase family protein [Alphaproteobacteria bacterium]